MRGQRSSCSSKTTAPLPRLSNWEMKSSASITRRSKRTASAPNPAICPSLRGFDNSYFEARWVAEKCRAYRYDGAAFEQMAVLYRTTFISRIMEKAFNELGVPYKLIGGISFFERREIKDLTSYLTCAVNPRDDVAYERILNVPKERDRQKINSENQGDRSSRRLFGGEKSHRYPEKNRSSKSGRRDRDGAVHP